MERMCEDKSLNQIIRKVLQLAEKEQHPDEAACLYAVSMKVDLLIGKEMLRIRARERLV